MCAGNAILKRGRVKVAHFAPAPGAVCEWAAESLSHRLAKRLLADRFRALGYIVELEEPHLTVGRRVDVAVTVPTGHRVAVEVQDCDLGEIVRPGESREWYAEGGELTGVTYPDQTLKSTKTVSRTEVGFTLTSRRTRYDKPGSPDITVAFTA